MLFIDAGRCVEVGVLAVGIAFPVALGIVVEEFGKDDFFRELDADREGVADHGPLRKRLPGVFGILRENVCSEQLADIVNEGGDFEPFRAAIVPHGKGTLQGMDDLGMVVVRIAGVAQLAGDDEHLHHRHGEGAALAGGIARFRIDDELIGLMMVILPVELLHMFRSGVVIPEMLFSFGFFPWPYLPKVGVNGVFINLWTSLLSHI